MLLIVPEVQDEKDDLVSQSWWNHGVTPEISQRVFEDIYHDKKKENI